MKRHVKPVILHFESKVKSKVTFYLYSTFQDEKHKV